MTNVQDTPRTAEDASMNIQAEIAEIPQHIASNLLEFLRRVQSTGMEAVAWVECYQYVQQHTTPQQPGAPFGGLPAPK